MNIHQEPKGIVRGDYVLATKYSDGDPGDHWAIGFYSGITAQHYCNPRYDIVDNNGLLFRYNGFRRIKKISKKRGEWLLKHASFITQGAHSVWYYARLSYKKMLEWHNWAIKAGFSIKD